MDAPRRLSRFLSERRSNGPPQRIFFLRQGFFLEEECLRAFKMLGLCVQEFQVGQEWDSTLASRLLTGLVEFLPRFSIHIRPHQLLTIRLADGNSQGVPAARGHLVCGQPGFHRPGLSGKHLGLGGGLPSGPALRVRAQGHGVSLGDYRPLAADTRLFRPFRHPPVDRFGCHAAAFVGSTWTERVSQQLARYAGQPETLAYIEAAARDFQVEFQL